MSSTVHIKWNDSAISLANKNAVRGLFKLGYDIADRARIRAPYLTGALCNTIRVRTLSEETVEVVAGGSFGGYKVDYAWIREQGPNRNPATEHYMENSAKDIMSGDYMTKYFGNIV